MTSDLKHNLEGQIRKPLNCHTLQIVQDIFTRIVQPHLHFQILKYRFQKRLSFLFFYERTNNPIDNLEIADRVFYEQRLINNMNSKNGIGKYYPFDHRPPGIAQVHRWRAIFGMEKISIYNGAIFEKSTFMNPLSPNFSHKMVSL